MNSLYELLGLDEICKSLKVFELLQIAHLLIQYDELSLDVSSLLDLFAQTFFNLRYLLLLENVCVFLKLLGYLLLNLPLFLDLYQY